MNDQLDIYCFSSTCEGDLVKLKRTLTHRSSALNAQRERWLIIELFVRHRRTNWKRCTFSDDDGCSRFLQLTIWICAIEYWRLSNWYNYLLSLFLTGWHLFFLRRSTIETRRDDDEEEEKEETSFDFQLKGEERERENDSRFTWNIIEFFSFDLCTSCEGDMNLKRLRFALCLTMFFPFRRSFFIINAKERKRARERRFYVLSDRGRVCACVIKLIVMFIYIRWHTNELSSCAASSCSL